MGLSAFILNGIRRVGFGVAVMEHKTLGSFMKGVVGRFLQALAMYVPMLPSTRVLLQRMRGVKIGKNVYLGFEVMIDMAYPHLVTIEDNVIIAGRNIIQVESNPNIEPGMEDNPLKKAVFSPIKIEQWAWITAGAIILPGVTVGRGSVVAAGAVVNRDVPPYSMVAGVPAKVIKQWEEKPSNT